MSLAALIAAQQAELDVLQKTESDQAALRTEVARLRALLAAVPPPAPAPNPDVLWRWDATSVAPFGIHAKPSAEWGTNPRVTLVTAGGRPAVRLLTMPGDNNVFGSGAQERCDLRLSNADTDAKEGRHHKWTHNLWLPDDYMELSPSTVDAAGRVTSWNNGLVLDFHNSADDGIGQANAQLLANPPTALFSDWPVGLHFQIHGGDVAKPTVGQYPICPIVRNAWLKFEYEMLWTSTPDGFFKGWLNGKQFMDHSGPTLYIGQEAYLKLANYHTAHGKRSAVLHGRVVRAKTAAALAA